MLTIWAAWSKISAQTIGLFMQGRTWTRNTPKQDYIEIKLFKQSLTIQFQVHLVQLHSNQMLCFLHNIQDVNACVPWNKSILNIREMGFGIGSIYNWSKIHWTFLTGYLCYRRMALKIQFERNVYNKSI
jgi:hypothetical protein